MAEVFAVHRGCFAAVIVVEVVVALVRQLRLVYELVHLGHRVPPPGGMWKSRTNHGLRVKCEGPAGWPGLSSLFLLFKYTGWSISSMPIKFGGDVVCLLSFVRNWGTGGA